MQPQTLIALLAAGLLFSGNGLAATEDDPLLGMLNIDQLEWRDADDGSLLSWDVQGWVGYDLDKLWLKSEGERLAGRTESAELQLLYGRAVAPFWDLQLGLRHDFKPAEPQQWLAFGLQGLAPYQFEVDATAFIGEGGQSALRLEAEYELLLSQRLILSPEIELNLYGEDDASRGIGSGLSDLELGLRLRYEIRREFAPYIGLNWERKFGDTADFAREEGESTDDLQAVIGIRAWF
ncbi:copper resistance protein B [Marinobacterium arenosum]|uniref:copper resistance protein B n=1 Tax=Marinobacterium arenosum TaxID=2862496 RepID=UPI001C967D2E|nr:copper resistance protein B [Marinobacterium arenosum]MBY4677584.1 copper resistance protein B [Marinobacterium arenosum]